MPSALSGGQQQRIALARCIVYEPSIILMDEPLGALDKKLREQMQLEIKGLHEQLGVTVLYVTHDQEEAMVMSDRICLLNAGEIEQVGPPDEMYFSPRTQFAAAFLGESNIVSGYVHHCNGTLAEIALPGGIGQGADPLPALGRAGGPLHGAPRVRVRERRACRVGERGHRRGQGHHHVGQRQEVLRAGGGRAAGLRESAHPPLANVVQAR